MNVPILFGMLLSRPTMFNTMFFQWLNQSYNAGMNFGNKNSTCPYTDMDIFKGYLAAVASSVSVGVIMRALTNKAGLTKGATGKKLLILNTLVGASASAFASFCNTFFMRYAEIDKGIDVFEDAKLEKKVGIS